MLQSDSNRFVPLISLYFNIYFCGGLSFQSILFLLICTKSPSNLSDLRYFLFNTCFLQICSISCAFFSQHRVSSYVLVCTIAFRYFVLKNQKVFKSYIVLTLTSVYIPSILCVILPFTKPWDFEKVRNDTYLEHPTYDLSIYEPFPGFDNVKSYQFMIATGLLAVGAYGIPLFSALLTKKIVQLISSNRNMSMRTKEHAKTLAYGLACQTLLPLISYIPMATCYLISQYSDVEILISEYLQSILLCFPSLIDPFISIYFIVPYRNAIINIFSRPSSTQHSIHIVATSKIESN